MAGGWQAQQKIQPVPSPEIRGVMRPILDRFEGWTAVESLPGRARHETSLRFLPEQGSLMDSWWAQPNASE